ncbi:MAG: proline dehydrogenase family protein [Bacteroidota bacterium]|jgi:proline dehydrogenase
MKLLNDVVVATMPFVPRPIVAKVAKRYIAGETLADAVKTVQMLNSQNTMATVDVLGEDVFTKEQSLQSRNKSISVLNAIKENNLDSHLSIKLTSLGLKIDPRFCLDNVLAIVAQASADNNFVRIDMEDHTCTDETLSIYRSARERNLNVGIVIQAYLYRSEEDIRKLASEKAKVRLCKGIYNESADIAVKDRVGIQRNYLKLLRILFEAKCYVGIATHDDVLIDGAVEMIKEYKMDPSQYEFQMLLGVRDERRKQLIARGHRMRVYVPFGKDWYGYSVRRLKENPQMAGHIFKAMFGIGQ